MSDIDWHPALDGREFADISDTQGDYELEVGTLTDGSGFWAEFHVTTANEELLKPHPTRDAAKAAVIARMEHFQTFGTAERCEARNSMLRAENATLRTALTIVERERNELSLAFQKIVNICDSAQWSWLNAARDVLGKGEEHD